ncbi:hypothetical protein PAXRUDRAFT_12876 [Paxillus rubicundulus Ve08.2h10]|uniref:Phytanoyl-CoA dioxygenase n=1 Tax=Paxillus rubicundulus Ve08.2h10 TaxID=930991 RepID=A0A0D0E068_9AGAM|nr:hypothetical protein PAXRUDRAFT_12876 [Paxillus rubicundulus Ve08.2h10]
MVQGELEYLTQGQVDQFYQDGYIRIPSFLSQDQVSSLLQRSKILLEGFSLEDHPLIKFTTSDKNHVGDDYFLNSGDKIRYFLEEDAVDENGQLTRDKTKVVNKIGHGALLPLHMLDPVFRNITLENEKLKAVARDLRFHHDPVGEPDILSNSGANVDPLIGGAVPEHNDSTFLYTSPPTALGFWIPLERCTPTNGALSFLPGSHLTTPITKRFVRLPGGGTGFEQISPSVSPALDTSATSKVAAETSASEGQYILEACEPGDLVLIHGNVLHKSERNTSRKTRYAYTFHMIDTPPYAHYDEKNWLQPTLSMPFPKILGAPNEITRPTTGF